MFYPANSNLSGNWVFYPARIKSLTFWGQGNPQHKLLGKRLSETPSSLLLFFAWLARPSCCDAQLRHNNKNRRINCPTHEVNLVTRLSLPCTNTFNDNVLATCCRCVCYIQTMYWQNVRCRWFGNALSEVFSVGSSSRFNNVAQTNRGRQEKVWAGGGTNILPPNGHQQIKTIIVHMYFSLPRPLRSLLSTQIDFLA